MNTDLTAAQNDYAHFLPALSGFYASYIGRQRYDNYVDPARIPTSLVNGVESLNYLNPVEGQFKYKWTLFSAGHANLDLNKFDANEDMIRNRDRETSFVLADSGGYQVGRGRWPADWKNPACPQAALKREQVLTWMDAIMDYGMCLDVPMWTAKDPKAASVTGINTYYDAVIATHINNEYFINNRNGNCKLLNVLQGENHTSADMWYDEMKKYSDPKIYGDRAFNGWAMGGLNARSAALTLRRICTLIDDGLLQQGQHDWMHFLGTGQLEWGCLFTDIQRAVRKYHNPDFTISFDCASPFLATAKGQIYTHSDMEDRKNWSYRMVPGLDDKAYATDPRLYKDAVMQDQIYKQFETSPIIDQIGVSSICKYKPGDLNKIKKEGKTSWDSFSYALMMGHNIWMHINAVQEANRRYDSGMYPKMLIREKIRRVTFRKVVDELFALPTLDQRLALLEKHERFLLSVIGKRIDAARKEVSTSTYFNLLFSNKPLTPAVSDSINVDDAAEFIDTHVPETETA